MTYLECLVVNNNTRFLQHPNTINFFFFTKQLAFLILLFAIDHHHQLHLTHKTTTHTLLQIFFSYPRKYNFFPLSIDSALFSLHLYLYILMNTSEPVNPAKTTPQSHANHLFSHYANYQHLYFSTCSEKLTYHYFQLQYFSYLCFSLVVEDPRSCTWDESQSSRDN